jgi:hypothetical protein
MIYQISQEGMSSSHDAFLPPELEVEGQYLGVLHPDFLEGFDHDKPSLELKYEVEEADCYIAAETRLRGAPSVAVEQILELDVDNRGGWGMGGAGVGPSWIKRQLCEWRSSFPVSTLTPPHQLCSDQRANAGL